MNVKISDAAFKYLCDIQVKQSKVSHTKYDDLFLLFEYFFLRQFMQIANYIFLTQELIFFLLSAGSFLLFPGF